MDYQTFYADCPRCSLIDDLEYAFCDRLTQEIKDKEAQQSAGT